ncbi:alpha-L-rhamnosidase C-terminal domain-containing protein [Actinoplanes sp. NPDC049316]|uniref:alpha-L-rhamnosidase C-terminal domain-containing protein n=1 Tax=Actinoplanes sp. NPDC049316 TaxID=3154727 RepID=UPI003427D342
MKPSPVGDLRHAAAHVDSPLRTIISSWKRTSKSFALEVVVPAGATATVHVPARRERPSSA